MVRVAVCVCTCDRAALLARLLAVLERVKLRDLPPEDVLVLIVDNRPDGRARAACDRFAPRLPMPLRFVEEPTPGISFARNRAVAAACAWGADFVAFLDDDDIPGADWLWQLVLRQHETGADLVFGLYRLPQDLPLPGWLRNSRYFREPDPEDRDRYGLPGWAGTYNVLIARRVLEELAGGDGPFKAEFATSGGEDMDLFIRAKTAGFTYAVAPLSLVVRAWEPDRMTVGGTLRRGFQRAGSRVMLARAHLPQEQVRRLAWSSWGKLGKALLLLPLVWNRSRLVHGLLGVTAALGEVYAWSGLRYDFYLRRRG
ncbi:MAG: glycosyltransferase family 2 protein [Geminicoccaceae bacterium]